MDGFVHILVGSLLLSAIHAAIPNHWLPLVTLSNSEEWSTTETLWITAITGSAHTLSTILLGLIVGLLGYRLSAEYQYFMQFLAPTLLVVVGLIYFIIGFRKHHHHHFPGKEQISKKRTKIALVFALSLAMFFSPCLEIEAYFFTAGGYGWRGISTVSAVYFIFTVLGMMMLVYLGMRGMKKMRWKVLERHEHKISGLVLISLGLLTYFVH